MDIKKIKRFPLLVMIYICGFLIGIAVLFAYPYFSHQQQLSQITIDGAAYFSENKDFDIDGLFGMNFLVYDQNSNCVGKNLSGFSDSIFHLNIAKYLTRTANGDSVLCFEWLKISSDYSSSRQIALVAAAPVYEGDNINGVFILIRNLQDLPGTLAGFTFTWSFIFVLLFLYLYSTAKKEQEFENLRRTYIAAMNHELKSPITSIKALTETLLDGYITDPARQMQYHSVILVEANTLEATVQDLLELSKLQSTKTLYRKETADAASVFSTVLSRYAVLCEDIDIHFQAPDFTTLALPPLYTAPDLISRVLDLLLHNAAKFTQSGSGEIQVLFSIEKQHLSISVQDNGCGISPDTLPHIFESFYREKGSNNSNGTGLGLSIVKEILDGLGESIQVKSRPDEGSTFTFTVETR